MPRQQPAAGQFAHFSFQILAHCLPAHSLHSQWFSISSELPTSTGGLIDSALNLPVPERIELANAILASFEQLGHQPSQEELDKSWSDEIIRVKNVESGRVKTIPLLDMRKRILPSAA